MENASKALIIAGAILISILIIGLGVYIYNMASSTSKKVNLNSQEAEAHNQQFTTYFGERQSSTDVKNLMNTVRSNNITGKTGEETQKIWVSYKDDDDVTTEAYTDPSKVQTYVKPGKTYKIKVSNDEAASEGTTSDTTPGADDTAAYYNSGYIRIITILENT